MRFLLAIALVAMWTIPAHSQQPKWKRPADVIGAAFVTSGASKAYLAAGGIGILTGDGALNYGPEKNVELYYDHQFSKHLHAAADY